MRNLCFNESMFDKFAFLCRFTKNSCRLVTIQKVIENNKFSIHENIVQYPTFRCLSSFSGLCQNIPKHLFTYRHRKTNEKSLKPSMSSTEGSDMSKICGWIMGGKDGT